MRLLDRYLLREFLLTLVCCLTGFCLLQIVYELFYNFSELLDARPSAALVLRYYAGSLAPNLDFTLPASLLLATLYTLWQLSRHGELTAMLAGGISLLRIMLPFLAVGLACSAGTIALKETLVPDAALWSENLRANGFRPLEREPAENLAYFNARQRRLWIIESIDLLHPQTLHGVKVTEERLDGTLLAEWRARRAEWLDGEWWFFDVTTQRFNTDGNPIGSLQPVPASERGLAMPFGADTPRDMVNEVRPSDYLTVRELRKHLRTHPDMSRLARAQKRVDLHLRLAMPWACLIVTFFGIPAGIRSARESVTAGVLLTIGFFFGFYGLTQVGAFLGKRLFLAPWLAAWLSNLVFFAAGIRFLLRVR